MIKELDLIVLTEDTAAGQFKAGDVGCVVLVHGDQRGFEVEFTTLAGDTVAVITLPASLVRPIGRDEIAHARRVA